MYRMETTSGGIFEGELPPAGADYALKWDSRMKIAFGVAEALLYLHKMEPRIAFRGLEKMGPQIDIPGLELKYILVDQAFNPQLLNMGNAVFDPERDFALPNTKLEGRGELFGYQDVKSFGTLLLELSTGRDHADIHFAMPFKQDAGLPSSSSHSESRSRKPPKFLEWVRSKVDVEQFDELYDPNLVQQQHPRSTVFDNLVKLALLCWTDDPASRPTMDQVLYAMQYFVRPQAAAPAT